MNRKRWLLFTLTALLMAALTGLVLAGNSSPPRRDFTEAPAAGQTQSEYMIVILQDLPAASYAGGIDGLAPTKPERGQKLNPNDPDVVAYVDYLAQSRQDYRDYLAQKAPTAEIVYEYAYVANGFAIRLNGARQQTIANGPGVATATFSALYQPAMNVSARLIGADDLWAIAGGQENAGAGIKVGIIDTGIDETHPFFACKDQIQHKVYASGAAFDPDNLLVFDHGTHVAGTVAGCSIELTDGPITGNISGIAPGAELYDYNVFPGFGGGYVAYGGSAFSHDIIAAVEDAVLDGMDVANMSLGGGVEGPHDILADAVNAAVDAGMVVVVAAGNSGPDEATIGSPGSASNALTVGASTNGHVLAIPVNVTGADGTTATYVGAAGDFDPYVITPVTDETLADWADTGGDITACDPAPDATAVTGKIALISRGDCTFTTKVRNAENAGAIGVVVYNNVSGPPVGMAHDGTDPFPTIPAVMVSDVDGQTILASLPAVTSIAGPPVELAAETDIIAGFSSRGPSPFNYLIKPDVMAPGVNVYSSVFDGEFAMFQGTSMATPHVAGSAALLLQLHPNWSPFDVKSALVNTAVRVITDGTGDPGVLSRGNGRIELSAANATPLTIDPVSASFGLWTGNKDVSDTLDLTILNVSGSSQTCAVTLTGPAIVSASASSISLAADESGVITLMLDAGKSTDTGSGDYDGDLIIDCGGDTPLLQAPWWVRIDRQAKP